MVVVGNMSEVTDKTVSQDLLGYLVREGACWREEKEEPLKAH